MNLFEKYYTVVWIKDTKEIARKEIISHIGEPSPEDLEIEAINLGLKSYDNYLIIRTEEEH